MSTPPATYKRNSAPKSLLPSRPATRISSFSPPGWYGKYDVMLYTLPLNADHASSRVRCSFSMEGDTRNNVSTPYVHRRISVATARRNGCARTLRSCPDFFRFAQSSGPWPGANATLLRFAEGFGRGFVVVGGTISELPLATPGCLTANVGTGGGGIRWASVRMRGMPLEGCGLPAR